jgi:hypothetical protein
MALHFPVGLLKIGEVTSVQNNRYNVNSNGVTSINLIDVKVGSSPGSPTFSSDLHFTYADNNGVFIGAVPPVGNPALILQEQGNKHQAISYYPTNSTILPDLKPGQLLLKNNDFTRIMLKDSNIILGCFDDTGLVLNTSPSKAKSSSFNNNFDYHFSFSQAARSVEGAVKREVDNSETVDTLKLINDNFFNNKTQQIGIKSLFSNEDRELDPDSSIKNYIFTENRKVVYEFEYDSGAKDLKNELTRINKLEDNSPILYYDRHKSRVDALSLSLNDPNYLIESIQGNVVDIYGNVLDLNRYPIKTNTDNLSLDKSFLKLTESNRRAIAFHFEINAKKDLGDTGSAPNVKVTDNYSRDRSRFFVDIDKEGQFKINIPASSESGNIPLLSRYENYNTVQAANDDSVHPNELLFSEQKVDILHDSFASGMYQFNLNYENQKDKIKVYNRGLISVIKDGSEFSPVDRISEDLTDNNDPAHLRHGTAYHDILATCIAHQRDSLSDYIYFGSGAEKREWGRKFPNKAVQNSIVSDKIEIGVNAGGRSGSINLDGSFELNIGANTIDRQSVWIDTAGGMVANFGKDKNGISAAMNMDGELLIQIGGEGIPKDQDKRFSELDGGTFTSGVLDIRVLVQGNNAAVIRVDKQGITLISPGGINLKSNGSIDISSNSNISISGENVQIQGRTVEKSVSSLLGTI